MGLCVLLLNFCYGMSFGDLGFVEGAAVCLGLLRFEVFKLMSTRLFGLGLIFEYCGIWGFGRFLSGVGYLKIE